MYDLFTLFICKIMLYSSKLIQISFIQSSLSSTMISYVYIAKVSKVK